MSDLVTQLRRGETTAQVSALGAALRGLTVAGRELVVAQDATVPTPPYAGVVLAPWPNRIADGRWTDPDGGTHQLPVNEVERGTALHGLALWDRWSLAASTEHSVRLVHTLYPRPGYPFTLGLEASYVLVEAGVELTVRATNLGPDRAPVGLSCHPYLTTGETTTLDRWTLQLPCSSVLEVDERLLPQRTVPVARAGLDYRDGAALGQTHLDHAFTDVELVDGLASAVLRGESGAGVEVTWDAASRWLQAYTLDASGSPLHRRAVALEPMTCAPDAFNSGDGLIWLAPGDRTAMWCRISAVS